LDEIKEILEKRLELISQIKTTFQEIFPDPVGKFRRGPVQDLILRKLNQPVNGLTRRSVNEALRQIGFKKIKNRGFVYYRKISAT
jgi:hypothetical protein